MARQAREDPSTAAILATVTSPPTGGPDKALRRAVPSSSPEG